ncbi:aspartyl protease family protein [Marinifilum sp. RC60d5]|uniref:aspartyl protease family protein n=1 Tax=Marinifilum sp. RC60d5 TaxID=3458414 RepID=UPI0040372DA4
MKYFVAVMFLFLSSILCCGNNYKKVQSTSKLKNKDFNINLPVEIKNNKYVLPNVKLNGSKKVYRFLLDTGAQSSCISQEVYDELGLITYFSDSITDGLSKMNVNFSFLDVSFNDLYFEKVGVSVLSKSSLNPSGDCSNIDGIIGYNLMRSCIWSFDSKGIVISDKLSGLKNIGKKQKEKISKGDSPCFVGGFVEGFRSTMLFDLGDTGTFEVKNNYLKYLREKKITRGNGSLYTTILGDIQDTTTCKVVHVPGFKFETDTLRNVITYVAPDIGNANIASVGAGILNYFRLTFDFPKRQLYVQKKDQDFNKSKFFNFGFKYKINEDKVVVRFVWNNTEASQNNIKPDQQILSINSLNLADISMCDRCELKLKIEKELLGNCIKISVKGIKNEIVLNKKSLF